MKKKITTENLIQQYFTPEEAQQLHQEIKEEVDKIKWGGKRKNAGRKSKTGVVLSFTARFNSRRKRIYRIFTKKQFAPS